MIKLEAKTELTSENNLLDILNDSNKRYVIGKHEYLLLLKKQKDKDYCTLYVTDCESKFWIKKVDRQFVEDLKQSMSINSDLKLFCQHFVQNLKHNSKLAIMGQQIEIQIELKIGTGLVMACKFSIQSSISVDTSPNEFKVILKLFLKQLFQAKEAQIQEEKKKWEQFRDDGDNRLLSHGKTDPSYVKEVLNPLKKDALEFKPKNRSLLNPNQKKRKGVGIKFQGEKGN